MLLQLLLLMLLLANSTTNSTTEALDKYSHLKLPSYPLPNANERERISKEMKSLYEENMKRHFSFDLDLIESEDSFYHRYESTCFE